MTDDPLSFIDNKEPATDAPQAPQAPEPTTSEATPATGEPARDEHGRFTAPKEPAPATPKAPDPQPAAPQAQAQPQAQPDPAQPHTVPLAKYLDERNEFRSTIREQGETIRQLQQQLQALQSPVEAPDPLTDPKAYAQFLRDQVLQDFAPQQDALRVNMSEQMVLSGPQAAEYPAAIEAFKAAVVQDRFLQQRVAASMHPAQEILNWHRQHKLLADIGTDPDAFVRRRFAELTANPNPAAVVQPSPKPAPQIPPASLGRAPAGPSAGTVPVGPGQAFDALFPG